MRTVDLENMGMSRGRAREAQRQFYELPEAHDEHVFAYHRYLRRFMSDHELFEDLVYIDVRGGRLGY